MHECLAPFGIALRCRTGSRRAIMAVALGQRIPAMTFEPLELRASGAFRRDAREQLYQRGLRYGFHEVMVESGFDRLSFGRVVTPARHRDQRVTRTRRPQGPRNF